MSSHSVNTLFTRAMTTFQLNPDSERVLVSFSCGPDSVAVTLLLAQLTDWPLELVYFDHGLRTTEVAAERQFFKTFCRSNHLKGRTIKLPVNAYATQKKVPITVAGRLLRHSWLRHLTQIRHINWVVTAHHLDDWFETVLLHNKRGSGSDDVPLRPKTGFGGRYHIIRPAILIQKRSLMNWLDSINQPFMTDSSNLLPKYARNRLRLELDQSMSYQSWQGGNVLRQLLKNRLSISKDIQDHIATYNYCLSRAQTVPMYYLKIVVKQALAAHYQSTAQQSRLIAPSPGFSAIHIGQIAEALKVQKSTKIDIPGPFHAKITNGVLAIERPVNPHSVHWESEIPELTTAPIVIPVPNQPISIRLRLLASPPQSPVSSETHAYLNWDGQRSLTIRSRQVGDRFQPLGMSGTKSLKSYLIDRKVPASKRQWLPLFFAQNQLAYVMGQQVGDAFKITDQTKRVLEITIRSSA